MKWARVSWTKTGKHDQTWAAYIHNLLKNVRTCPWLQQVPRKSQIMHVLQQPGILASIDRLLMNMYVQHACIHHLLVHVIQISTIPRKRFVLKMWLQQVAHILLQALMKRCVLVDHVSQGLQMIESGLPYHERGLLPKYSCHIQPDPNVRHASSVGKSIYVHVLYDTDVRYRRTSQALFKSMPFRFIKCPKTSKPEERIPIN